MRGLGHHCLHFKRKQNALSTVAESGQDEVQRDTSGKSPPPASGGEQEEKMDPDRGSSRRGEACRPRPRLERPMEAESRLYAVRFTQDEHNVLAREFKARRIQILGTSSQPPHRSLVNQAWAEIAAAVSAFSGISRSVSQVKKRVDTYLKRRVCCLDRCTF